MQRADEMPDMITIHSAGRRGAGEERVAGTDDGRRGRGGVKVRRGGGEEEGWVRRSRLFIFAGDNNDLILWPFYRGLALQVTVGKC